MFKPRLGRLAAFVLLASIHCGDEPTEPPPAVVDPGALIRVTTRAQVGVLLDEIPAGDRDRIAALLVAKGDAFWEERARAQVELAEYKLTFREFFYDEGSGKRSLNLPPPVVWRFDIDDAGPKRMTVDGHDVLAVAYDFESVILSGVDGPATTEPALGVVGGVWDESFVWPVDPYLVLQRTGYACIDEAEFPPRSADAESVRTYFDDTCEVETPEEVSKEGCHQTLPLPTESCVEALENHVGRTPATIHFERVAWDEAVAAEFRVGTWTSTTGADVQPVSEALDHNYIVYRYIQADSCEVQEKCVGGTGWRRLLRFDAFLKNTGQKDMVIGEVDYFIDDDTGQSTELGQHNIFEYSACHDHYHFLHYGQFDLNLDGATVSGSKRAFCLETGTRHFNDEHTSLTTEYSGCDVQGLTAGWGDEYGASLDCQWFDITDVDTSSGDRSADLAFIANPDGFLCEGNPQLDAEGNLTFEETAFLTDDGEPVDRPVCDYGESWDANNTASRPTTLPQTGGYVTEPCRYGAVGPLRDCGFSGGALEACIPGEAVTRSCSVQAGKKTQVVRVCEGSLVLGTGTACAQRDALANVVIGEAPVDVAFTCPTPRDADEVGGAFALYAAPLMDGDETAGVDCVP